MSSKPEASPTAANFQGPPLVHGSERMSLVRNAGKLSDIAHIFPSAAGTGLVVDTISELPLDLRGSLAITKRPKFHPKSNQADRDFVASSYELARLRGGLLAEDFDLDPEEVRGNTLFIGLMGVTAVYASLVRPEVWQEACEDPNINPSFKRIAESDPGSQKKGFLRFGRKITEEDRNQALVNEILERSPHLARQHANGVEIPRVLAYELPALAHLGINLLALQSLATYKAISPPNEYKHIAQLGEGIRRDMGWDTGSGTILTMTKINLTGLRNIISYVSSRLPSNPAQRNAAIAQICQARMEDLQALTLFSLQLDTAIANITGFQPAITDGEPRVHAKDTSADTPRLAPDFQKPAETTQQKDELARQNEQLFTDLQQKISGIATKNEALLSEWNLTSQTLKKRGLNDVIGTFVRGCEDIALDGRSKSEAKTTVSLIEKLRELAQTHNPESLKEYFDEQSSLEDSLTTQLQTLLEQSTGLGNKSYAKLLSTAPEIFSPQQAIENIQSEWPTLRKLIHKEWPNGQTVVRDIEQKIFSQTPSV